MSRTVSQYSILRHGLDLELGRINRGEPVEFPGGRVAFEEVVGGLEDVGPLVDVEGGVFHSMVVGGGHFHRHLTLAGNS